MQIGDGQGGASCDTTKNRLPGTARLGADIGGKNAFGDIRTEIHHGRFGSTRFMPNSLFVLDQTIVMPSCARCAVSAEEKNFLLGACARPAAGSSRRTTNRVGARGGAVATSRRTLLTQREIAGEVRGLFAEADAIQLLQSLEPRPISYCRSSRIAPAR